MTEADRTENDKLTPPDDPWRKFYSAETLKAARRLFKMIEGDEEKHLGHCCSALDDFAAARRDAAEKM